MGRLHDGTHTCVVRIEDGGVSSINESNSVDNAIDVSSDCHGTMVKDRSLNDVIDIGFYCGGQRYHRTRLQREVVCQVPSE